MTDLLRNRSPRATFLCYHSIAAEGPRFLTVAPDLFERQLDEIRRRGLRTGGLAELEEAAAGQIERPTVFLTFDDGFLDNHRTALPMLRDRAMRAFVFVLPPLLDDGAPLAWPEVADDRARFRPTMRSVDWDQVGEMQEAGFVIGSHTLSHPRLTALKPEALREELAESRALISARLGSCETLAYPFGEWSPAVAAAAAECGYRFAFTLPTEGGQRQADPLSIPRINVDHRDERRRFGAKLARPGKGLFLSPSAARLRRRTRALRGAEK
jgi:peptidoglycan/xylan/chitin deacetylase (PgdA/CDA1 family)